MANQHKADAKVLRPLCLVLVEPHRKYLGRIELPPPPAARCPASSRRRPNHRASDKNKIVVKSRVVRKSAGPCHALHCHCMPCHAMSCHVPPPSPRSVVVVLSPSNANPIRMPIRDPPPQQYEMCSLRKIVGREVISSVQISLGLAQHRVVGVC